MDVDASIQSEMSEMVHLAKKWASGPPPQGLERMPQISIQELRAHEIGKQIITRAALKLLHQLGIKSPEDYKRHFGELEEQKNEAPQVIVPVSPMSAGEFSSILERGWQSDTLGSPSKRRPSMLNELVPLSPIVSEDRATPQKTFAMPQKMTNNKKLEAPLSSRKLFKTPRANEKVKNSMTPTQKNKAEMTTPQRTMDRFSPPPSQGETPFENRASRLRRLKLEEKRKSIGGNSSMNSSFGCQ